MCFLELALQSCWASTACSPLQLCEMGGLSGNKPVVPHRPHMRSGQKLCGPCVPPGSWWENGTSMTGVVSTLVGTKAALSPLLSLSLSLHFGKTWPRHQSLKTLWKLSERHWDHVHHPELDPHCLPSIETRAHGGVRRLTGSPWQCVTARREPRAVCDDSWLLENSHHLPRERLSKGELKQSSEHHWVCLCPARTAVGLGTSENHIQGRGDVASVAPGAWL